MFDAFVRLEKELAGVVRGFDATVLSGPQATRLLKSLARIENLVATTRALTGLQIERSNAWRGGTDRSAADAVARATGRSRGQAQRDLDTARRLADGKAPATDQAARNGELSMDQASETSATAEAAPEAEAGLVSGAKDETVGDLRTKCRQVRASKEDEDARYQRMRSKRQFRSWSDDDGMIAFRGALMPHEGAAVLAAHRAFRDQVFRDARACGRRDTSDAYDADAFVALAHAATTGGNGKAGAGSGEKGGDAGRVAKRPGPKNTVHVLVDHAALVRGHIEGEERCEIPGLGAIPVSVARHLANDAYLKVIVSKGLVPVGVAHDKRQASAYQRSALETRDPCCVVPGCNVRQQLEIDHVEGWAITKETRLDDLARLCRYHHDLKTYGGYTLGRRGDRWHFDPPAADHGPPIEADCETDEPDRLFAEARAG